MTINKIPNLDEIMSRVQEFASTWAMVGSRFDDGSAMDNAVECKAEIRALLAKYEHGQQDTVIEALIADDAYAVSFQTIGQYRAALIKKLGGVHG